MNAPMPPAALGAKTRHRAGEPLGPVAGSKCLAVLGEPWMKNSRGLRDGRCGRRFDGRRDCAACRRCDRLAIADHQCATCRALYDSHLRGAPDERARKSRTVRRTPCDEDLRPPAVGAVARPRLLGVGHRRQEVPRRARRHRRQHARPCAPEAGAGAAGADRQADPHLELLPRAAAGAARREAVRAVGADERVLLQHRPRGQRRRR